MILRRIAKAITDQDWLAVVIELIVVIVGIFVALQVNDWAEQRKNAAREVSHLERLLADTEEMIARHEAYVVEATEKVADAVASLGALRECRLQPGQAAKFDLILLGHQGLPRLPVVRSGYDELVASGVLADIGDAELRNLISRLFAEATINENFVEWFTSDLNRASDIIWQHVSFELDGAEPQVVYDFEDLCNSVAFRNAIFEVFDSASDRLRIGKDFSSAASTLRDRLIARLVHLGARPP